VTLKPEISMSIDSDRARNCTLSPTVRCLFALFALCGAASAGAVSGTLPGTLAATDPTFNRSLTLAQGGTCSLSTVGTAVNYRVLTLNQTCTSNLTLSLRPIDGASITPVEADTFLMLHSPAGFNPAAACTNAIAANDDAGGALSRITTTTALPAGSYSIVVTAFANSPAAPGNLPWTYNVFFSNDCPAGPVAPAVAVDSVSRWGVVALLLGLLGLGLVALRRLG
jgi:hypothetical protein